MWGDGRLLLAGGAAAVALAALPAAAWVSRKLAGPPSQEGLEATGFEAYLRRVEPNPCAAPSDDPYAATSFEAYLRAPSRAAVDGSAAADGQDAAAAPPASGPPPASKPVLVLYGTEYGFSKEVAERAAEALRADAGRFWPQLVDMADHPGGLPLERAQALLVAVSTQGDGVPPGEAREFCDWLAGGAAPQLGAAARGPLRFSVCALGDRSYQHFARCGRTVDARLEALGGQRLAPRADINREDWPAIEAWLAAALEGLRSAPLATAAELGEAGLAGDEAAAHAAAAGGRRVSKQRPYCGTVSAVQPLCTLASADDKNTVMVEIDLGDSGLEWAPGDALGVWPTNAPQVVAELIEAAGLDGKAHVPVPPFHWADDSLAGAQALALEAVLAKCYDLRSPKHELLRLLHTKQAALISSDACKPAAPAGAAGKARKPAGQENGTARANGAAAAHGALCSGGCAADRVDRLAALLGDEPSLEAYLEGRHVADVLRDLGAPRLLGAGELLGTLRQLAPRLYSISSSQLEAPSRVQVTVAEVAYTGAAGRPRHGVASAQLCSASPPGARLPVFVHRNPDFRLPADPATPVIMVGPGTGLAPFRAFMQERLLAAQAGGPAPGPALLFFGCRRRDQDYLYASLLEAWAAAGHLTLRTAFSREQAGKVYVQDRLAEASAQVWDLLSSQGAHFYVCGDAASMAPSVERALLAIIAAGLEASGQPGGKPDAQAWLDRLGEEGRYQRDVWF